MNEKTFRGFSREIVECVVDEDLRLPREGPPHEGIRRRAVSILGGATRHFAVVNEESFITAQREALHLGPSDRVVRLVEVVGSYFHIAKVVWVNGSVALLNGYVKLERLFEEASMVWTVEVLRSKGYTLFVHSSLDADRRHGAYYLCVVYRGSEAGSGV